jgi:hypothetical protein
MNNPTERRPPPQGVRPDDPAMVAYTMVRRLRSGGVVDPAQILDPDISRAVAALQLAIRTAGGR